MTMNKYADHVFVIPEDEADRQIADGFVLHHQVKTTRIQVMPPAGGWPKVLQTFIDEYIQRLKNYHLSRVVLLIDFDGDIDQRLARFEQAIPQDLRNRVFVVGTRDNPEILKNALNLSFEMIGQSLANDCTAAVTVHWDHEQLHHNEAERQRMVQTVKPFLF
jgi:hypothetical protein